jgi:hypothetical protein
MGEIVNLSQFRKRRERELKETRARGKHVKSGKNKADHKLLRHEIEQRRRKLDGNRLDQQPGED